MPFCRASSDVFRGGRRPVLEQVLVGPAVRQRCRYPVEYLVRVQAARQSAVNGIAQANFLKRDLRPWAQPESSRAQMALADVGPERAPIL